MLTPDESILLERMKEYLNELTKGMSKQEALIYQTGFLMGNLIKAMYIDSTVRHDFFKRTKHVLDARRNR